MTENFDSIISSVILSYGKNYNEKIPAHERLPERNEVTEIISLLRCILFPGYFDKINMPHAERHIGGLVVEADYKLRRQICRALSIDVDKDYTHNFEKAGEICREYLGRLSKLREILLTDVRATFDGDPAAQSEHEIIFAYPGIFAISIYRLAHELQLLSVPLIPRMMTEYAHGLTGIDIHPGAEISHHFCIDHGTGIVIGETAKIGAYVKLYQGVTLGALSTRGGQILRGVRRHPTLEDEVTVYSGASILGGDTVIGKGSVIGGNTFIIESIPPYTRVSLKKPELELKTLTQ